MVGLNPPEQYADDRNLRARQRFWQHQSPPFDFAGWVLGLAGLSAGVVADVRRDVQAVIDQEGAFITSGDLAAFVCR